MIHLLFGIVIVWNSISNWWIVTVSSQISNCFLLFDWQLFYIKLCLIIGCIHMFDCCLTDNFLTLNCVWLYVWLLFDWWLFNIELCLTTGCMHMFDCPAEQYIPLYLLIGGIAVTAKILKALIEMYKCKDPACSTYKLSTAGNNALEVLLIFFIVGWFIAGRYFYRVHWKGNCTTLLVHHYIL